MIEKLESIIVKQVQNGEVVDAEYLTAEQAKINEIISHLNQQEEKNNEFCDCDSSQSCQKCNH